MKAVTTPLQNDFIFTESLTEALSNRYLSYCLHIFCTQGRAQFSIDGKAFTLTAGQCIIKSSGREVNEVVCSDDLEVFGVIISMDYLRNNAPNTAYDVGGILQLQDNPIMEVPEADMPRLKRDVDEIQARLAMTYHLFYEETLRNAVGNMVYDLFDVHSRVTEGAADNGSQAMLILQRFVALLSTGIFKEERKVSYYADRLFITPKYLSEACVKASGHNASYWIDYFLIDAISKALTDTDTPLIELSEEYRFSSLSHFSRYVKSHLGVSPTEYRK
ncbi:transcriptional regulator [Capnocytophaga sp. HP1101]